MARLAQMDEYDSRFGRRLVDEDFLAAGFTPEEVQQYRGAISHPSLTPEDRAAMEARYGLLQAPDYTMRQTAANRAQDRMISEGMDPYVAGLYSRRIFGDTAPTDGGLGIGLADLTPLGIPFSIEEGSRTAAQGYQQGDPLQMGFGALEAGMGLLEATPLTAAIGRGISNAASRMDPNTLYSLLGPPRASSSAGEATGSVGVGGRVAGGLPEPRNAAEQAAREILDMRAAGRAGEVTDEMMAQADPQYMFANTPLPMDEASRMARADEMGITEDFYKGMYPYDPNTVPVRNWRGEIIEGADRVPTELTSINRRSLYPTFNRSDQSEPGWRLAGFSARDPDVAGNFSGPEGAIYPLRVNLGRQYVHDAGGKRAAHSHFFEEGRPFRDAMRSGQYDSGVVLNSQDEGDFAAILRPENIRSRFARFDPEFRHLRNLNAAIASPFLGLLAMMAAEEQRNGR